MVPLYLPLTLDENDQSAGTPIFFSGVNVYLQQKFPWLRRMPKWLHHWLAAPALLKWAAGRAAKTRAEEVGDLTLSMFRGENGHQARELDELIAWLKAQIRPEAICLSNALLIGLARRLRVELDCPVVCMLTGEDSFLDNLPPTYREQAWKLLSERARDGQLFIAPTRYFADLMIRRLNLAPERVRLLPNGLNLEAYPEQPAANYDGAVIGYFARMCREKGLDLLVDAFLELRRRNQVGGLTLKIGGGCGPGDEAFVAEQRHKLGRAGLLDAVEFHPNLARAEKVAFLKSLSVFSVPALYGEAFGLYLLEAMAAGVPVVQPQVAAFPEIIEATGGGILAEPTPVGLADRIQELLLDRARLRALGTAAHQAVHQNFNTRQMAANFVALLQSVLP
jgi:glycosyltransferase involved in cell wall biosynthesis